MQFEGSTNCFSRALWCCKFLFVQRDGVWGYRTKSFVNKKEARICAGFFVCNAT